MYMRKIFTSFLICSALCLGSLPAHADDLGSAVTDEVNLLSDILSHDLDLATEAF